MSSHVHIGLYDALREAGASEERRWPRSALYPSLSTWRTRKTC